YVTIEENVFENNWVSKQNGKGILFTPRNQNGNSNWCELQYETFRNNVLRNSAGGMNILGTDDIKRSKQLIHVTIENNLFHDIGDPLLGASVAAGWLFSIENKTDNVVINHNTGLQAKDISFSWGQASTNFAFTNNVVTHNTCSFGTNDCGMAGTGTNPGLPTLTRYFTNPVVTRNVMFEGNESGTWTYPPANLFPAAVSFNPDYTLNMNDPGNANYIDGNGKPLGIDSAVEAATAGVVQYTRP
ncbi:MAG: hypothetical protein HY695_23150, partial [Deltaproteobacteria bacterium]|nr:hypothetical protein [Deltaproteobacteria bacterium]